MKRFFFTLIASVSILGMTSCVYVNPNLGNQTSPETVKEVRAVPLKQMSGFTAIATKQAIKTAYTQAGKPSIKVKSNIKDPNLLDIRVDDKKLIIGYKPTLSSIDGNLKTFVEISGYDVNEFEVSSAGEITAYPPYATNGELELKASSGGNIAFSHFKAKELKVEASSAAELILEWATTEDVEAEASSGASIKFSEVTANQISADASSGAVIKLNGKTKNVSYEASSGASIKADNLVAETGTAKSSSGADVDANVKQLTKKASSGGRVKNVIQ